MTLIKIMCPSCDEFYEIPYQKTREMRDYAIVFACCPTCHSPRDPDVFKKLEKDTTPRCEVCKRPNFNGKKLCDAHYMQQYKLFKKKKNI